jgi:acyl-CoA thioesterase-1
MRSQVETPPEVARQALAIAAAQKRYNHVTPVRFIATMKSNHGSVQELDDQGLPSRNPLIVAFGDSVTAGWFEGNTLFPETIKAAFLKNAPPVEHITDIENVYHEVFRLMLSEKFERTSVSLVNSGISGDNVVGMVARIDRDVIRYLPDLVLVNASLNGPEAVDVYAQKLKEIAVRLKNDTPAEMVFITPNLVCEGMKGTLDQRVEIMIKVAEDYGFAIADAYGVWKKIQQSGIDIQVLLANHLNHPTITGHRIYALELMKLFE